MYGSLGHAKSSVITGCDVTSKLRMKDRACPEDYFQSFGEKEFVSDEEIRLAEQYLIKVLHPGSKCKSFDDLLVECYMHKNISLLNLPPASRSVEGHILRCFYIIRQQTTLLAESNHELKTQ